MKPPYVYPKDRHDDGAEVDALHVYAHELMRDPDNRWPDLLLMLGDQVYVDEGSPETREFIRSRRDVSEPPGEEVLDFEEYTRLYHESWREPYVRWLFSTVPSAMVIDDHDISDDWNISRSWKEEMDRKPWWHQRVEAGYMTYWIYQHLGNLSPDALSEDETYAMVRESRDDAGPVLRDYARRAYEDREGIRWSYRRDLCDTRVIVMDSRGGRVLEEGRRSILDEEEREWVGEQAEGNFDHLLIATSDPFLLSHGIHHLEAWSEAVCDGAWGGVAARLTEKLRRAEDFDHWASFGRSFRRLSGLLREVGSSKEPPLRHRSSCSRATCIMPTWRRWASRLVAASKAASTRPSARRFGIRWTSASAASYETCFAGRRRRSRARWRVPPACPIPRSAGASPRAPTSTTRWPA